MLWFDAISFPGSESSRWCVLLFCIFFRILLVALSKVTASAAVAATGEISPSLQLQPEQSHPYCVSRMVHV